MNESSVPASLPNRLVRVVWDAGYGWPTCTHRRRTARNFASDKNAARQVVAIRAWPSHHVLVGVWETTALAWRKVDVDTLPYDELEVPDD